MRHPLLVLVVLVACGRAEETPAAEPAPAGDEVQSPRASAPALPEVGQPAPALALVSIEGERFDVKEACARGPVVLVFGSFT